jgi:hypothetical protein
MRTSTSTPPKSSGSGLKHSAPADPFRELPGYRGSMTLLDRENARLVGIGFYASDAEARETEKLLPALLENARAQVPDAIRATLERRRDSVGLYDIVHRD